jgi:selenophosphate synthase
VHPDRVLLNAGSHPGDVLFLTKPIGTGILSTAIKGGLAGSDLVEQITRVMTALNKCAAEEIESVRCRPGMEGEAIDLAMQEGGFALPCAIIGEVTAVNLGVIGLA